MVPPLLSCMISLHGLSYGSSSAFRLHSVRTFWFSIFLWFGSSWQWSNRPPKTINSCRSVLHLGGHVFCTHCHSFDTEVSFSNLYWNPSYFIPGLPRFVKKMSIPCGRTFVIKSSLISFTSIYIYNTICEYCSVLLCKISTWSVITFQYYK
jgi:hypothetical protein